MTLSNLAVKRPITTLMVLVSVLALGGIALLRLPLAFMPDVQEPQLFVHVPYPGASPQQVERYVIQPLEDALGTVRGLKEMRSWCDADGGRVNLQFDWGFDVKSARIEVREKIDRVRSELPDDADDIMISTSWDSRDADSPIIEARISSSRDLSESYELLERKIVRPIERIPGVAQVRLDGVNPKEVRIDLRPADLESHRVDVRDVLRALSQNNFDQSLGEVTDDESRLSVRTTASFTTVDQIRNLHIRPDGLRIRDIATVVYEEPPLEYGRHLDGKFAVGVTVSKESNGNTVAISQSVQDVVAEMNNDPDLQGVSFLIWQNQGAEIEKTLGELAFTGGFGAILASIVLFLFLRRLVPTALAVACIPFSLVVACGVIWAQGRSLNTLTLMGLIVGVGMLVDNAVVVIENIYRHRERGRTPLDAARIGAGEVSLAVIAATVTSVIVFLPMIFNEPSETNIYLKELGITVCITLLASLFVSQTLIPLVAARLERRGTQRRGRLMQGFERNYLRLLKLNLRHRWLAPLTGLIVIGSMYWPYSKIDMNFDMNETEVFVQLHYEISEEWNFERKEQLVSYMENLIEPHREQLAAKSVYSFWSDRFCMTRIYLKEGHAHEREIMRVREELRTLIPELPGVTMKVSEPGPFWRQNRGKRIAFQLYGDDSETLAELAEEAQDRLREIDGLIEPFASTESGGNELHVEIDRELAAHYGLRTQQPAEVVSLTYRGRNLPRFRTPDGEKLVRLTYDDASPQSMDQLQNLPLYNREGERVPLGAISSTAFVPGPERIQRENRMTSVWVGARYQDGTRDDYMAPVTATMSNMTFPDGYGWTLRNIEKRRQEQTSEFATNLLLALMLIFAVMASLFESIRQAIALMIALPFALAGAAWTLYLTGYDFDQPAAVGLLLLIGIVVNNGIVMIEHVNMYRRRGMRREWAMVRGGRERLRPIVMTAATTLLGLLPMVIQKPALGGVYYYTMAFVIMGGLVVSTFLTTILLPTTVIIIEDLPGQIVRAMSWPMRRLRGRSSPPVSPPGPVTGT